MTSLPAAWVARRNGLAGNLGGHAPDAVLGGAPYHLRGRAVSALPLNTIEIVVDGEIVPRNLKTNRDAYAGLIDEPL